MRTIVCFGDSNTHGYDAETMGRFAFDERYPNVLGSLLGKDYDIKEEGLSGRTTVFEDPLYEGMRGLDDVLTALLTHEPVDLLIIMLGTNDTKERYAATPSNIGRGLERLILKAKSAPEAFKGGKRTILVITPPPIEEGYEAAIFGTSMGRNCVEKSRALAKEFEEVAKRQGCHYLDAGQVAGLRMNDIDFMHLTREGHSILGRAVFRKVKEIFKEEA